MRSTPPCHFTLASIAALSVIIWANTVHSQDLSLVGGIVKAMQDASATIDDLDRLQTALTDYQLGKNPNSSGDWSTMGDRFQSSAKASRHSAPGLD
jgi:hypothetical protein